jgi:hypothetical protein
LWLSRSWSLLEREQALARNYRAGQTEKTIVVDYITADTIDGEQTFVINDGSTGICQQLRNLTDLRTDNAHATPQSGALVKGGLKLSEYDRTDEKGTVIGKGKTYYLSN